MAVTDTKEKGLESLIVKWLVEHNGITRSKRRLQSRLCS